MTHLASVPILFSTGADHALVQFVRTSKFGGLQNLLADVGVHDWDFSFLQDCLELSLTTPPVFSPTGDCTDFAGEVSILRREAHWWNVRAEQGKSVNIRRENFHMEIIQ